MRQGRSTACWAAPAAAPWSCSGNGVTPAWFANIFVSVAASASSDPPPPPVPTRNSIGMGRASAGVRSASPTRGSQKPERAVWPSLGRPRSGVETPRRPTPSGGTLPVTPRATVRQRDVRHDDANRRGAGLERSCRRSAVVPPAGRAHPCPGRDEFALAARAGRRAARSRCGGRSQSRPAPATTTTGTELLVGTGRRPRIPPPYSGRVRRCSRAARRASRRWRDFFNSGRRRKTAEAFSQSRLGMAG